MQKVIFGIFAHPDDEAFGPAGTLLLEKAAGSEVHLICATAGENGMNPDNTPDLGAVRLGEWRNAGALIGADSMHHLGYLDGTLNNTVYLEIADKIKHIVTTASEGREAIEIEFMTLDLNGLTGHIDHIVMARVACFVFYSLKATDTRMSRIRFACISNTDVAESNCDWLYMESGRSEDEIAETIDASAYLEQIKDVMHAHDSQRGDREALLSQLGDRVAINHFLVRR